MENKVEIYNQSDTKARDLFLGILFDLIGMISYIIPGVAEGFDIIWAPISAIILAKMYSGYIGKIGGTLFIH